MDLPARLNVARLPTPLEPLDRIRRAWGGPKRCPRIWVKRDDETGTVLSGNKIRKLQFAVHKALQDGADTLVTCGGLQSNHCRATAALARRIGMDVSLVLRGEAPETPEGNYLLDRMLGAAITFVDADAYRDKTRLLTAQAESLRAAGKRPFVIAEGCSMPAGVWGYVEAAEEIGIQAKQLGLTFSAIVHAIGSGGTTAGLALGLARLGLPTRTVAVAVCDNDPPFQQLVPELIEGTLREAPSTIEMSTTPAIEYVENAIGPGYGIPTPEQIETQRIVARLEGLILDPVYSGKAFHGLSQAVADGRFTPDEDVLFLHTGGVFGAMVHGTWWAKGE